MRNYLPMASGHQEMTALEKLLVFRQLHHSKKRGETMLKKAALHILFHNWKQGSFSVLFWDGDRKNFEKEPSAMTP